MGTRILGSSDDRSSNERRSKDYKLLVDSGRHIQPINTVSTLGTTPLGLPEDFRGSELRHHITAPRPTPFSPLKVVSRTDKAIFTFDNDFKSSGIL